MTADLLKTRASARAARSGFVCPLCGAPKGRERALCATCMKDLDTPTRNRLYASVDDFIEAVRELRDKRVARFLGLKVVTQ